MIRRIHIKNFKSLVDVEVELSPVTVLIGKSGTGKSNFVEAIRLVSQMLTAARLEPWSRVISFGRMEESISIEIDLNIANVGELQYSIVNEPDWKLCEEKLTLNGQIVFHSAPKIRAGNKRAELYWAHSPSVASTPQPAGIMLPRLTGLPAARATYVALNELTGIYSFSDNVLLGPVVKQGIRLSDDATNYHSVLARILGDLNLAHKKVMIDSVMNAVNSAIHAIELDNIIEPNQLLVERRGVDSAATTNLTQESAGTRRFLAHLLALFQSPSLQTLIFEHPEDGVHPHALATLAAQFSAAPEDNRGQVILTTHSPQLLDHFEAEQIRVVEMTNLRTQIGPLATDQRESIEERLLYPGELFTVTDARIGPATVVTGPE